MTVLNPVDTLVLKHYQKEPRPKNIGELRNRVNNDTIPQGWGNPYEGGKLSIGQVRRSVTKLMALQKIEPMRKIEKRLWPDADIAEWIKRIDAKQATAASIAREVKRTPGRIGVLIHGYKRRKKSEQRLREIKNILDLPPWNLTGLGVRASNALKNERYETVDQMVKHITKVELLRLPNFGKVSLKKLEDSLARFGISLRHGRAPEPPKILTPLQRSFDKLEAGLRLQSGMRPIIKIERKVVIGARENDWYRATVSAGTGVSSRCVAHGDTPEGAIMRAIAEYQTRLQNATDHD